MTVLIYFVCLQLLTLALAPVIWLLLRREPLAGHGLAKLVSLVTVVYLVWLAGHTGPHYNRGTICLALLALAGLSLIAWRKRGTELREALRTHGREILILEAIFTVAFFLFVWFRMYNPEISYDVNLYAAEKFPDMAFFHSLIRSPNQPPPDLWFTGPGNSINYYYFGYVVLATVAKLAGTPAEIAFNLALATIFALSLMGAYSLLTSMTGRRTAGLLGAVFLVIMGNLYGFTQLFEREPFDAFDVWHGSRVIVNEGVDSTINEFPLFSFVLGDLHAHVLAIPLALLVLHLLWVLHRQGASPFQREGRWVRLATGGLLILALGALITGNAWDLPAYLMITAGLLALGGLKSQRPVRAVLAWLVLVGLGLALVRFVLFAPFFAHYAPPDAKVELLPGKNRSPIDQFLTIHGYLFALILPFLLTLAAEARRSWRRSTQAVLPLTLLVAVGLGLGFQSPVIGLLAVMMLWGTYLLFVPELAEHRLPLLLATMGAAVTLGCEFVYIKDFYGGVNIRMNTVFKFYYEAWIFFTLAAAYGSIHVLKRAREGIGPIAVWPFRVLLILGLGASMIYPVKAVYIKCDKFKPVLGRPTLDGTEYIRQRFPADHAAIHWLRENALEGSVVLEATGKPYSYFGRVSTLAGLPTVLGWGNHESLWRDWTWKSITERTNDVKTMFKSIDTRRVMELMDRYAVDYVFVGSLEEQEFYEYDQNGRAKFGTFMDEAYLVDGVSIFRRRSGVNQDNVPPYRKDPALLASKEDGRVVVNQEGVTELKGRQPVLVIGREGSGDGQLKGPKDLAIGPNGHLYVADSGNHRIVEFTREGEFVRTIGSAGAEPGQFNDPSGLDATRQGRLYVADTWNYRVQLFDLEGNFQYAFGDNSVFWAPKDVEVTDDGLIYVVDTGYHRIHVVAPNHVELQVWGSQGSDPGQLDEPVGMAIGPGKQIYVADTVNKRISLFGYKGEHQADYYVIGWDNRYVEPYLALDPTGRIMVASDSAQDRIQIYGLDGRLKAVWKNSGTGPGQFRSPKGLAFDPEGRLYVSDSGNGRIQVFAPFREDL